MVKYVKEFKNEEEETKLGQRYEENSSTESWIAVWTAYETKRTYLRLRRDGLTTKQNCANGYHRREGQWKSKVRERPKATRYLFHRPKG